MNSFGQGQYELEPQNDLGPEIDDLFGKRAWNSGFPWGMGKRSWNGGFTGNLENGFL